MKKQTSFLMAIMLALFLTPNFASAAPTTAATVVQTAATTAKAAVDSTVSVAKSATKFVDTSSNFARMYGDFRDGIIALAGALKVGAEHVYTVLVKQQVVNAVSSLIMVILLAALSYWILFKLYPRLRRQGLINAGWDPEKSKYPTKEQISNYEYHDHNVIPTVSIVAGCIVGGIALIVCIVVLDTITMGFINPEYGAIKQVIEIANQIRH